MGHLINPTAYRLGFFSFWKDYWIAPNLLSYTETLHNMFVLRRIIEFFTENSAVWDTSNLLYSHYSLEQHSFNLLSAKIFFYDSVVEKRYQMLVRLCKRLHKNQNKMYFRFVKLFKPFSPRLRQVNAKVRKLVDRWLVDRGFFEYFLVRRLVFFFLLVLAQERIFSAEEFLQIKMGGMLLLEQAWRENIISDNKSNIFEFFIGFFMMIKKMNRKHHRELLTYRWYTAKGRFRKKFEVVPVLEWFDLEVLQKLGKKRAADFSSFEEIFKYKKRQLWVENLAGLNQSHLSSSKSVGNDIRSNIDNSDFQIGSLLIFSYLKVSHNIWYHQSNFLKPYLQQRYLKYRTVYKKMKASWSSEALWAVEASLGFYRMYIVRSRHTSIFKSLKLLLEPILNKVSLYPVSVDFHGFDNDTVTACFLSKYLTKQFERRFKIRDLFGPIGKDLRRIMSRTPYLLGYKLQFVGRLTRRDRLRTSWTMGGKVPVSTVSAMVEHSCSFGILRNGVCSVRVWLYRPRYYGNYTSAYLYKILIV